MIRHHSRPGADSTAAIPVTSGTRGLGWLVIVLVTYVFVTGGGSQASGWDDAFGQWLALPVLVLALLAVMQQPSSTLRSWALIAAGLIVAVPLLQLLPLPVSVWRWPAARQALAGDLATAGVVLDPHWTLSPAATERALLSMLPAMAAFAGCLALDSQAHRRLLRMLLVLAVGSLVLGFVQLGLPQESLLNPFPQWVPALGGVFANHNHQATMLVIAADIALIALAASLRRWRDAAEQPWKPWALGTLLLFMLGTLPLTGSRAGAIIALLALVAAARAAGLFRVRTWASRRAMLATGTALAIAGLGLLAAIGWMRADEVGDLRPPLRQSTAAVAAIQAPLGAGVGSFVPVFEQGAPAMVMRSAYINHAHNEYLQWWLEGGWLALLAMVAAVGVLMAAGRKLAQRTPSQRSTGAAALIGVGIVLAHSLVDYPLRTPALMTVTAALAGIAIAQAARIATTVDAAKDSSRDGRRA